MSETIQLYWLDDENIFGFDVDESLISVHPIRSAEELLEFAPSWANNPRPLEGDVIVCDFKLVPDPERVTQEVKEVGLDMDAAGFLAGLLLAIGNRQNPLAVIPYSGEHTQFDKLWKLTKAFCPPWIVVGEDFHFHDKSQMEPKKILDAAVKAYRDLLKGLFRDGTLTIDQSDRRRMLALRSDELRNKEKLSTNDTLSFLSGNSRRSIKLGSLFYDEVKGRVQASGFFSGSRDELDPIVKYFEFLPEESEIEKSARELVGRFIESALSDASCDIYEGAITGEPGAYAEIPMAWIGSQTQAPDLEVRRLAFLRTFVVAFCWARTIPDAIVRLCDRLTEEEPDWQTKYDIDRIPDLLMKHSFADSKNTIFFSLLKSTIRRRNMESGPDFSDLSLYFRALFENPENLKSEISWKYVQLLDPLPQRGGVKDSIRTGERNGDSLIRVLKDARSDVSFKPLNLLVPQSPIPIKLPEKDLAYVKQCILEIIPIGLLRPEFSA